MRGKERDGEGMRVTANEGMIGNEIVRVSERE